MILHSPLRSCLNGLYPDDRERVQALLGKLSNRAHAWEIEYRVLWPDGSVHWLHSKGAVFPDSSGRPVRSTGVILDITERKRVEAALHRSEQEVSLVLDHTPDGIMRLDRQLRCTYVNAKTVSSFGIRAEALIGRTIRELGLPQFLIDLAEPAVRSTIETGQLITIEFSFPGPEGVTEWEEQLIPEFAPDDLVESILIIAREVTERKRLARSAEARRKEVQASAASLMTAQEDERQRVSRELHDTICQQLASLAMDIGGLAAHPPSHKDAPSLFRALQARVVQVSKEARSIAYELHPAVLDDLGLVFALLDLCWKFRERAPHIALEFTTGALPDSVPRDVTSCVYRIARESLQNVAKHSKAKQGSIALAWEQGAIVLKIADDGDGFDHQRVKGMGGLGLIGMEERARLVNGKLTIASQVGNGTRVTLQVPLEAPALGREEILGAERRR